jgi:hypothetical protein
MAAAIGRERGAGELEEQRERRSRSNREKGRVNCGGFELKTVKVFFIRSCVEYDL